VLEVAREYKKRGIPLAAIVIDYFHWTEQGEWRFDPKYWPDPEGMCKELKKLGLKNTNDLKKLLTQV
jgi:alpha-D-xyloside xylohydrolase